MAAKSKPHDNHPAIREALAKAEAKRKKREAEEAERNKPPAPPLITIPPVDLDAVTDDDVIRILKAIVVFDPRRLYREDGTPISFTELDDATALAIAGLEVDELFKGGGETRINVGVAKKYKTSDRVRAAQLVLQVAGRLNGDDPKKKNRANLVAEYFAAIRGK